MNQKTKTNNVRVQSENCKGCGLCIEFCKSDNLAYSESLNKMGYRYAEPVEENKCTGCMVCALMCPDLAIEVYDE